MCTTDGDAASKMPMSRDSSANNASLGTTDRGEVESCAGVDRGSTYRYQENSQTQRRANCHSRWIDVILRFLAYSASFQLKR